MPHWAGNCHLDVQLFATLRPDSRSTAALGFFDLFVTFLVLWAWSLFLGAREGSSPWVGRWQWIVGLALAGSVLAAGVAPLQSMSAPPDEGGGMGGALSLFGSSKKLGYGVLALGAVWLAGLTVQTFAFPVDEDEDEGDA